MEDLIKRLKKSNTPDIELDAEIYAFVTGRRKYDYDIKKYSRLPHLTGSIDAGIDFFCRDQGGDCFWRVGHDGEGPDPADYRADVLYSGSLRSVSGHGVAGTAERALCIAALTARAHKRG